MKVFNSKLAAIGLAAFVFASCSDSSSDPATPITSGTVPSEITKIGLTQTDAAQLAASVTNYKRSSSNKARTRAIDETLFNGLTESTVPEAPSVDGAKQLNTATNLSNDKYKTRSGKTYDFSNNTIENTILFVAGNSTVKYSNLGSGNTIVVLMGGKLEYTGSESAIPQNNTIYVLESGSYSIKNENITIDGTLYSSRALGKIKGEITDKKSEGTPTQNITINGSVYLSGYKHTVTDPDSKNYGKEITEYASLRAKTLTINADAKVNTLDRVTFTNDVVIAGALHVGKAAIVKNMTIKNGGVFYSDYSAKIKNQLTMEAGSYMDLKYLNVTDNEYTDNGTEKPTKVPGNAVADLQGACKIVIGNHGVMSFNTLKTDNTSGQIVMGDDANNVAVIKADKFIYAGSDENVNFTSTPNTNNQTILAQFKECYKNGEESAGNKVDFDYLNWNADVQSYDYITGGGALTAGPNFSYVLKDEYEVAKQKKLMLLSTIANYERDTQSATAIVPTDNNKVYVSYHTNGAEFGGSIDVAEMNGEQLTLRQRVQQAEAGGATYDFNHLNVINNKLYLAGSAKGKDGKQFGGATVSYAAIGGDGTLNVTEGLSTVALDNTVKGDANCVVPFDNNIAVASTLGYSVYEPTLAKEAKDRVSTTGKAKFVAVNGTSLVGLNYTSEITAGDAEVQGEVQVFDNSMKQTSSFNVGSIAPNNGKNMIAIDSNGRIYVCKSAKGLMCYENGSPAWASEWTTPTSKSDKNVSVDKRQGYINGVAVDDNYVYVAAGAYGLVVLTKDGKEVTHKRIGTSGNSANYVAVKNGLIYVAYGKGRIQVFKLTGGDAQQ
ncbi:hypothetical protein ACTQ16_03550 [Prevotella sp. LCP21S3_D2]|uniref:hypothetical protein n=1 Tax=Prevotella sp. LCP21S3_D2 TaxID=3438800 RepID=UPI003F96A6A8